MYIIPIFLCCQQRIKNITYSCSNIVAIGAKQIEAHGVCFFFGCWRICAILRKCLGGTTSDLLEELTRRRSEDTVSQICRLGDLFHPFPLSLLSLCVDQVILSLARGCDVSHSTVHIFLAEGCAKKNGLFDETDMGSLHMGMHAFACRKWELRGRFDWAPSRTCRRVALPYISVFLAINIEHAPLVLPVTLFMKRLKFPPLPLKTIQTVSNLHCV